MNAIKFTAGLFVLFLSLLPAISHSEENAANKAAELNTQIKEEVKTILQLPYLRYSDKNMNGKISVVIEVDNMGKIIFKNLQGLNEDLLFNVKDKLNSLNLWTSPDYSGKVFVYNIKYKN